MPMATPDVERLLADGTRHDLGGRVATVWWRRGPSLALPSARILAGESSTFGVGDEAGCKFVRTVAPGQYPVVLAVAVFEKPDGAVVDEHNAAARLVIRDEPIVSWELATAKERDAAELEGDQSYGYLVDDGFFSPTTLPILATDQAGVVDRLLECIDRGTDQTVSGAPNGAGGAPRLVIYSSGRGDDHYPTWVGRTADGEIGCFLTDFLSLTDHEDQDHQPGSGGPIQPAGETGSSELRLQTALTQLLHSLDSITYPTDGFGASADWPATRYPRKVG